MFDFGEHGVHPKPSTVYTEAATGAVYLDKTNEVAAYEAIWASVEELALDEDNHGT
ncbi:Scr1 family TA system antitoxin-like transcriptional regulator [Plantactinospora sp. B6F1]|uniref:Scr1 family TA system antitoxin-like transcriptional regulator n=1 Tax=Plantactinospora sp. B6F1 TaxID=3158971 RepID=UPI0032D93869